MLAKHAKGKISNVKDYNNRPVRKALPVPRLAANTLFTFTTKIDFMTAWVQNGSISARYCEEKIDYLKIGYNKIAMPMKCFCDINIHRLGEHLDWYGHYGLGFSKEWGMKNGIQPVQYLNTESDLCKSFKNAFKQSLKDDTEQSRKIRDYIATQLAFIKPTTGKMRNRVTGKESGKCFTDEFEWRYVPDVSRLELPQFLLDESQLLEEPLNRLSNVLDNNPLSSVPFETTDIKYIIIKDMSDYQRIIDCFNSLEEKRGLKDFLVSKVLVWEDVKEDF